MPINTKSDNAAAIKMIVQVRILTKKNSPAEARMEIEALAIRWNSKISPDETNSQKEKNFDQSVKLNKDDDDDDNVHRK